MISAKYSESRGCMKIEIPMKLPSLNDYIKECRANKYGSAKFKKDIERKLMWYMRTVPYFEKPIKIHFHWVEENRRRDLDNVAFAKKFILDAMVKGGLLKDDNRRFVVGFTDSFSYADKAKVVLTIEEVEQ